MVKPDECRTWQECRRGASNPGAPAAVRRKACGTRDGDRRPGQSEQARRAEFGRGRKGSPLSEMPGAERARAGPADAPTQNGAYSWCETGSVGAALRRGGVGWGGCPSRGGLRGPVKVPRQCVPAEDRQAAPSAREHNEDGSFHSVACPIAVAA